MIAFIGRVRSWVDMAYKIQQINLAKEEGFGFHCCEFQDLEQLAAYCST